jgi:hypothetical protein
VRATRNCDAKWKSWSQTTSEREISWNDLPPTSPRRVVSPSVRPFYNSSAGLRIAQAFWFNTCVQI